MTEDERAALEAQRFQDRSIASHFAAQQTSEGESAKVCRECGNSIPKQRREALRGVMLCIGCKQAEELADKRF